MSGVVFPPEGSELTEAISSAMVELYASTYGHARTSATTYINDDVVVCILKNILTDEESRLLANGGDVRVTNGRVAFQSETEDVFSAAVERITQRKVVAFMSANQTQPGIASELFFLEPETPLTSVKLESE
jgi:uncharacterized protein YbcI